MSLLTKVEGFMGSSGEIISYDRTSLTVKVRASYARAYTAAPRCTPRTPRTICMTSGTVAPSTAAAATP